jgi:hypothetical protein
MADKIFISYRHDDVASFAGRVFDRLEREFGRDALFMDVDAISLGVDFVKVIDEEVAKCDLLLAIIGPRWLGARDEDGNRRLDNQDDFVRIEIEAALKRDILAIPIRVDGTPVPKARQSPDEIKRLASRPGSAWWSLFGSAPKQPHHPPRQVELRHGARRVEQLKTEPRQNVEDNHDGEKRLSGDPEKFAEENLRGRHQRELLAVASEAKQSKVHVAGSGLLRQISPPQIAQVGIKP